MRASIGAPLRIVSPWKPTPDVRAAMIERVRGALAAHTSWVIEAVQTQPGTRATGYLFRFYIFNRDPRGRRATDKTPTEVTYEVAALTGLPVVANGPAVVGQRKELTRVEHALVTLFPRSMLLVTSS